MYQFNIMQDDDGLWRFELDGINLLIDAYSEKDGKHWIKTPSKAIAFFNLSGNLYGVSNDMKTFRTVEDFFDSMHEQYSIFKSKHIKNISSGRQQNGNSLSADRRA
ncbi:MAG: hypothetical protein BGO69_02115 [Bacteroidetes bacterium 46-16]|nr:MAG: hypothetical protein BGO69_02115 [Bacteroidetes bacterium 46-16]